MAKTRLLTIVHTESSLGWGGQEIRILTEARGLLARGHRVSLLAATGAQILAEAPRFGVPALELPIGTKRLAALWAMKRGLATAQADIVNSHSSTDTWLAALALKRHHRPVLVRTRHVSIPIPNDFATRWLYRKATSRIVTTGDALREQLIRDNGIEAKKIDSVPTGIDAAQFAPRDAQAARAALDLPLDLPLIGIVATLRSWKGHRFLIQAMPLLMQSRAMLVIVGDGPQRQALQDQVKEMKLAERVRFVGQLKDVAPWFAAFDVVALPSYANEGVPQSLLQAMFTGIACVTTDAGAIGEIARDGDTALVVAKEDAAALAAGLDTLLADAALRRTIAFNARAFVLPRYGLSTMLDRMETVFRRALAHQRHK